MNDNVNIFDTVVCTSSEFRDTNNEIYSDFPILESPVFYADQGLLGIARRVAERADRDIHFGLATTGDIFTENISPAALCIDMEIFQSPHSICCTIGQHALCGKENLIDRQYKKGKSR